VSFLLNQQRLSTLDTPEVTVRYDAYVSYPPGSRREALKIVEEISKAGISFFSSKFDAKLMPGEDWQATINQALASADTLLFFIGEGTSPF
jgi:hypothetical protein